MYVSESKLVRQPHIEPHKEIRVMRILLESGSVGENDNRTEGCYLRILMMQCIFNMMIWIFFYKGHVEHKLNFVFVSTRLILKHFIFKLSHIC